MPSIQDIPLEVLIDDLLPVLEKRDLYALACTNRYFASASRDNVFWRRELLQDFNFDPSNTARITGFKLIYQGLSHPKFYVWGQKSEHRLGLQRFPKVTVGDVPFPVRFDLPGVRIVGLAPAGMSFNVLDSNGDVHVWGVIDGSSYALSSDDFTHSHKRAETPLRLLMPNPIRSLSCGRVHLTALDAHSTVWTFLTWGRPVQLDTPLLDCTIPETTPLQIESGWAFTSVLTRGSEVLVWFPEDLPEPPALSEGIVEEDGTLKCRPWTVALNPTKLPPIPTVGTENDHLIKIAALDQVLIALSREGHVFKCNSIKSGEIQLASWTYLPEFSEPVRIKNHDVFASFNETDIKITHISGHFKTFVAYSTGNHSILLMGSDETQATTPPVILPTLQDIGVISVVLGDYHYGALTASGQLLTWGSYSKGALGLGDPTKIPAGEPGGFATEDQRLVAEDRRRGTPPNVLLPTAVQFGSKKQYCFGAAAAGWHMGALVVDIDGEDELEQIEYESDDQRLPHERKNRGRIPLPQPPFHTEVGGGHIGILPIHSPFRVGFAGRGRGRGDSSGGS